MTVKRWLTQAEYAVKFKVNRSTVSRAVKAGRLHRRTSDGKVDGLQDIRERNLDNTDTEALRKEKLVLQNSLMRVKLNEEREKIAAEAIRNEYEVLAKAVDQARGRLAELDLTVEQAARFKEILTELYERICKTIQPSGT